MAEKKNSAKASPKSPAENKKEALETALAQIEKQFGKGAVMKLGANTAMQVDSISTGSLGLDLALGVGKEYAVEFITVAQLAIDYTHGLNC